jgi:hypothetical protein
MASGATQSSFIFFSSLFLLLICDPPATSDGAGWDGGRSRPALHQNGVSTKPFVVFASSWFDTWKPKTYGEWGLVPYGTSGLVSAPAIGAKAIAPPIPATANHGAMYLIAVFMVFSCHLVRPTWTDTIIAIQQTTVVTADAHLGPPASWNAGADSAPPSAAKAELMAPFTASFNVFTTAII